MTTDSDYLDALRAIESAYETTREWIPTLDENGKEMYDDDGDELGEWGKPRLVNPTHAAQVDALAAMEFAGMSVKDLIQYAAAHISDLKERAESAENFIDVVTAEKGVEESAAYYIMNKPLYNSKFTIEVEFKNLVKHETVLMGRTKVKSNLTDFFVNEGGSWKWIIKNPNVAALTELHENYAIDGRVYTASFKNQTAGGQFSVGFAPDDAMSHSFSSHDWSVKK